MQSVRTIELALLPFMVFVLLGIFRALG